MNKIGVIKEHFRSAVHYEANLRAPESFNEKIQWLKLFYQAPLITRCSDKIAVKDYVREKLGRDICIPTLATYRTVEEFRMEDLPSRFVLKLNSSSGRMMVSTDEKPLDPEVTRRRIAKWLQPSCNHYFSSYEWGYKNIRPGIIAEQLLGDGTKLRDYKFFCFNGEPRLLYTTSRLKDKLHVNFHDLEWNPLPFSREYPVDPEWAPRPDKLDEMVAIARTLAADFPFVRVDLYCIESRIFFGELTFYPGNGTGRFEPEKADYDLGAMLTLPDHALFLPDVTKPPVKVPRGVLDELFDLTASRPSSIQPPIDPEKERLLDKIERMQKSYSWRLTAPGRFLRRIVSKPAAKSQSAPAPDLGHSMIRMVNAMSKIDVIKEQFRAAFQHDINLRAPKSYNEKLQWLKLFYQDPLLTRCADKITVKDYIREKLGRDICIPTLATYRAVEEFCMEELPDQFILKLNSGSGQMLVCTDKKSFDVDAARAQIATWLEPSANHYFSAYEWCYKNIQPGVIAEELLGNGEQLRDYKFLCFNGEPRCLYTTSRWEGKLRVDFYDFAWNHLPFSLQYPNHPQPPPRPDKLEEMIAISKTLAADFPFVRVDFYFIEPRIFFGELTFYPGNGAACFHPAQADHDLGALLTLPDHALFLPDESKPPIRFPRDVLDELFDLTDPLPQSAHASHDPEKNRLVDKIERMQKSYSWRLTAPVRFLRRALLKLSGKPPVPAKVI